MGAKRPITNGLTTQRPLWHPLISAQPQPPPFKGGVNLSKVSRVGNWQCASNFRREPLAERRGALPNRLPPFEVRGRASASRLRVGSLWRFSCWFTRRSLGIRFQRSPQGQGDHGRQWSISTRFWVNTTPLQTQAMDSPSARIRSTACRPITVSRVGSSQTRAASACPGERMRPIRSA